MLTEDSQKLVFLSRVKEDCLEVLDLMVGGDIYQSTWDDLKKICFNYSRLAMKKGRGHWSLTTKVTGQGISKLEISNLLTDFK